MHGRIASSMTALTAFVFFSAVSVSCVFADLRTVFAPDQPLVLSACPTSSDQPGEEPQRRSAAALLKALKEHRWKIGTITPNVNEIEATACRLGSGDEVCITMRYEIGPDGIVKAYTAPGMILDADLGNLLIGWMRNVEAKFELYRCMVGRSIGLELELVGIRDVDTASTTDAQNE